MPTQSDQVCQYPDENGGVSTFPITGTEDAETCRRWGGRIVNGDSQATNRISSNVFRSQLDSPTWEEAAHVDSPSLRKRDFGAILLSFPLCEVHRRLPSAEFVRALDRLDSDCVESITAVMSEDSALSRRIHEFAFRMSSLAASTLAASPDDDVLMPVSNDLLEFGLQLAHDIKAATDNTATKEAIDAAVRSVEPLRAVPLNAALARLADTSSR